MITVLGFTGTRQHVPEDRLDNLYEAIGCLARGGAATLHHGMCFGMDEYGHGYATTHALRTHGWPSNIPGTTAPLRVTTLHTIEKPLVRNRAIVDASDLLIAVPMDPGNEELRSGTWATVRYARAKGIPILFI